MTAITGVIGTDHRRDAQHLEAANRAGCAAFVTADSDVLDHAAALEELLGFRILAQDQAVSAIEALLALDAT